MDEQRQSEVAVWGMLVVSFVILAGFVHDRGELTAAFVAYYWGPVLVVTYIGVLPTPWRSPVG